MDCVRQSLDGVAGELVSATCETLGYATPNFTTAGIYRLHGRWRSGQALLSWSLILKIVKPDSEEKNNPAHHNYWRREPLVFESRLLETLPPVIGSARSYLVEHQPDGTLWLWMEHVQGRYPEAQWEFDAIARRLGSMGGAYAGGKPLPEEPWICREWLRSWVTASRRYAPRPASYLEGPMPDGERRIQSWFESFSRKLDLHLETILRLPRVLAHQDLSQMNMLLRTDMSGDEQLVLIDWQFMSLSGVGEDLGKLYGVNMSLGVIPIEQFEAFGSSLYRSYIAGLREAGWPGDDRLARYGFCLSTAARSVWEVPQYFALAAQRQEAPHDSVVLARMERLARIIEAYMTLAREAERLQVAVAGQLADSVIAKSYN